MKGRFLSTLTQLALVANANYLAYLNHVAWYGIAGLALTGLGAIAGQAAPAKYGWLWKMSWAGTLPAWAGMAMRMSPGQMNNWHALEAGQIALMIFLTGNRPEADQTKTNWNLLGLFWGFVGTAILLQNSYETNAPGPFCLGLAAGLFLLVLCRLWLRQGPLGIQAINTLILLLVLLPAADLFLRFRARHDMNLDPAKYYSYEFSKKHPAAYPFWTRYYSEQWNQMWRQVAMYDTTNSNIFSLRPDTHAWFFHSLVSINREGYRGPEFAREKGNAYRIVVLGESTTFGVTMNPDDRPWPELLEQMIGEQLHPARPVQVINAGIPAARLPGNIRRLTNEILALKPDMLISYHGYNGFDMLVPALPRIVAKPPPSYAPRPLKLLADFEYALKLSRYKETLIPAPVGNSRSLPPLDSAYAAAYRKLIQIAEAHGIRLVLANYSMAVNAASDPALIAFYNQTTPGARQSIRANEQHSEIVRELAKDHPDICFVDTQSRLDGKHENFIDLMHFTQAGDRQMAEIFFNAIRTNLETTLGKNTVATANDAPERQR